LNKAREDKSYMAKKTLEWAVKYLNTQGHKYEAALRYAMKALDEVEKAIKKV